MSERFPNGSRQSPDLPPELTRVVLCPGCNHSDILDEFDGAGADDGHGFCPTCCCEVNLKSGMERVKLPLFPSEL